MLDKSRVIAAAAVILAGFFAWQALADDPPGVIPPIKAGSEANALPGWGGSLAYSPLSDQWLVVSPSSDYIMGQMMSEKNKPIGTPFKISASKAQSGGPKVAYDNIANKFLVVWVDYSNNTATIYGQFVNPKGALIGQNFKVTSGTILLFPQEPMQFDSKNKKFVFGWGNAGVSSCIDTVGEQGEVGQPICIRGNGAEQTFDTFIAVNPKANEYCIAYSWYGAVRGTVANSGSVAIRSINATTGAIGPESLIADNNAHTQGIVYNSVDDKYITLWQDLEDSSQPAIRSKITKTCADDPGSDSALMSNDTGLITAAYNPTSNTLAYIGQSQESCDIIYIFDASSLDSASPKLNFFCGSNKIPPAGGNFSPVIAPNTTTGTFAAISSQDREMTKFISNLGWGNVTIVAKPADLPPPQTFTPPTEGLPTDLGQFIGALFLWSLRIIGMVIFIRFFWAGFKWFTAAGNTGRISDAKEIMKNAALGAVVLFAAYLILYSINPDFVAGTLNLPGISNPPPTSADVCVHKGFCQDNSSCTVASEGTTKRDDTCTDSGDSCGNFTGGTCKASPSKICSTDADCK